MEGSADGTTAQRNAPTLVVGEVHFLHVSAGDQHTCGVTTDHAVYCWGGNIFGQVGDGTTTDRLTPTRVVP